jgi:hypothetical protein
MIRRALLVPAAALALAACGGDDAPAGQIPREKFVAANIAVRSLPDGATPEQRAAALRKHGVTEKQLKAWINAQAREPEVLAKAWEEIAFKLDSLGGAVLPTPVTPVPGGTAAPVPPPPRPPLQGRPDSIRLDPSLPPPGTDPRPERLPRGRLRPTRQVQ